MVDRTARDLLAETINDFVAEDIGAFEFDNRIFALADASKDETVQEVVCLLWSHYDDFKDHKAMLSQAQWNYFQRFLLLLRSDATLKIDRQFRWTPRQWIAVAALVGFVVGVFLLGFGWQVMLLTIPLGIVSMVLALRPKQDSDADYDDFVRLTPYSSISEMLAVYRTVPAFRKRRYPSPMKSRRIRGPIARSLLWLQASVMWLVFSPLVLLVQAFPEGRSTSRIVPA